MSSRFLCRSRGVAEWWGTPIRKQENIPSYWCLAETVSEIVSIRYSKSYGARPLLVAHYDTYREHLHCPDGPLERCFV
jgi:hypothetical protein